MLTVQDPAAKGQRLNLRIRPENRDLMITLGDLRASR